MKFSLKKELTAQFPKLKVGLLVAKNLDNTENLDQTYQILWDKIQKRAKEFRNSELENIPEVKNWLDAFEKASIETPDNLPSHAAMLQRVINRQEIPTINPLVNLYNAQSLKSLIPLGGHDLDKIKGDIKIGPNSEKLGFTQINGDKKDAQTPPSNEIVYADEEKVMTRKWVWRQSKHTTTTEKTQNILIPLDDLGIYSKKELKQIAIHLKSLIQKFCTTGDSKEKSNSVTAGDIDKSNSQKQKPEFSFAIVSKDNPQADLDNLTPLKNTTKIKIKTHKISKDPEIIKNIIERASEDILPSPEMLRDMLTSGKRLNVYQGFDPTAPTLHIGHTAGMRKLKYFQQLGHNVIFLIGDFTARVGDPTDKSAARQKLTKQQVMQNLKKYKEQAGRILDFDDPENPVQIRFNSKWLEELNFGDILELTSEFTVQQMLKRDMFRKRLDIEKPIYLHEFLYPVMQAYDSVEMNIDVEIGGNDQMFNMSCGRDLTGKLLNKEKVVLPNKLLVDPSGKKMGKSEGNMIMLSDSAKDIYGKVMAFSDTLIAPAFELLTDVPLREIEQMQEAMLQKETNPMKFKKRLAFTITAEHKGEKAAHKAEEYFEKVFQKKASTAKIPEIETNKAKLSIIEAIADVTDFAPSNSQAKRLIKQGAVSIDGKKIKDKQYKIELESGEEITLRVGKKIAKIINKS